MAESGNDIYVRFGDSNSKVAEIQSTLNDLKYSCHCNGIYDLDTINAVAKFKEDQMLGGTPDVLTISDKGALDIQHLIRKDVKSKSSGLMDVGNVATSKALTFPGEYTIEEIQAKLTNAYNNAPASVKNRAKKIQAVVASSRKKMSEIYITEQMYHTKEELATIYAKHHGASSDSSITSFTESNTVLKPGSKSKEVASLQTMLEKLGYDCGNADGIYGIQTKNAVIAYQRKHHLIPDGIVGQKTKDSLKYWYSKKFSSTSQKTKKKIGFDRWPSTIRMPMHGNYVAELQSVLVYLGYSCGNHAADGYFGDSTRNAVMRYQIKEKLSADGIVGPTTRNSLKKSYEG